MADTAVKMSNASNARMAAMCRTRPDATCTARGNLEAGILLRSQIRAIFDMGRVDGLDVEVYERKRLLGSIFTYRMRGVSRYVGKVFAALAAVEGEAGDDGG